MKEVKKGKECQLEIELATAATSPILNEVELTDILNAVKNLFSLVRIKGVDSSLRFLRQVVSL